MSVVRALGRVVDTDITLQEWAASLPSHLQFTEDNLDTHTTMFETSSNSGAWCFCFMHALHPCCHLGILEVRFVPLSVSSEDVIPRSRKRN